MTLVVFYFILCLLSTNRLFVSLPPIHFAMSLVAPICNRNQLSHKKKTYSKTLCAFIFIGLISEFPAYNLDSDIAKASDLIYEVYT